MTGSTEPRPASPLASLLTIPVTLGAWFGANKACVALGVPPEVSWVVALVAYSLTHRAVRGRWPLQRPR
ncbi:MAG: hypothetical protein SFW67_03855 [Myxococcaceae bacterium]|nr:hypothetical protein [Myxococcaceae bacterium]